MSASGILPGRALPLELVQLHWLVQTFDIGTPAQLGSGPQERGRSRRQAEADGFAQRQPPGETENDAR